MKTLVYTLLLVAGVFVLALAVDQITPLKQFSVHLDEHPEPYRSITVGMSIIEYRDKSTCLSASYLC